MTAIIISPHDLQRFVPISAVLAPKFSSVHTLVNSLFPDKLTSSCAPLKPSLSSDLKKQLYAGDGRG